MWLWQTLIKVIVNSWVLRNTDLKGMNRLGARVSPSSNALSCQMGRLTVLTAQAGVGTYSVQGGAAAALEGKQKP